MNWFRLISTEPSLFTFFSGFPLSEIGRCKGSFELCLCATVEADHSEPKAGYFISCMDEEMEHLSVSVTFLVMLTGEVERSEDSVDSVLTVVMVCLLANEILILIFASYFQIFNC